MLPSMRAIVSRTGLRKLRHALAAQKIVKLMLRSGFRRLVSPMEQIAIAQQVAGFAPVIEDNEQSSTPSFREIECDRKQPVRKLLVPQCLFPDSILLDSVRQMPASVKEAEYLRAVGENLDLSVRRQNQADVATSAQGRAVMRLIAPRAWHREFEFGEGPCPLRDVHQFDHQTRAIHQGYRAQSIADSMKASNRRQVAGIG